MCRRILEGVAPTGLHICRKRAIVKFAAFTTCKSQVGQYALHRLDAV